MSYNNIALITRSNDLIEYVIIRSFRKIKDNKELAFLSDKICCGFFNNYVTHEKITSN